MIVRSRRRTEPDLSAPLLELERLACERDDRVLFSALDTLARWYYQLRKISAIAG